MTSNVFEDDNGATASTPTQPTSSPAPDTDQYQELLKTITREDGSPKYDSLEKAMEGFKHSQDHIARLEAENRELREVSVRAKTLEEMITKMQGTPSHDQNRQSQAQTSTTPTLTEDQIAEMANRVYDNRTRAQIVQDNLNKFSSSIGERFGDKAREEFNNALSNSGLTKEQVQSIASTNPAAAIKILGLDKSAVPDTQPRSTQRAHPAFKTYEGVPEKQEGESNSDFFKRVAAYYRNGG